MGRTQKGEMMGQENQSFEIKEGISSNIFEQPNLM
mgnify:CR=1 FL=1